MRVPIEKWFLTVRIEDELAAVVQKAMGVSGMNARLVDKSGSQIRMKKYSPEKP